MVLFKAASRIISGTFELSILWAPNVSLTWCADHSLEDIKFWAESTNKFAVWYECILVTDIFITLEQY